MKLRLLQVFCMAFAALLLVACESEADRRAADAAEELLRVQVAEIEREREEERRAAERLEEAARAEAEKAARAKAYEDYQKLREAKIADAEEEVTLAIRLADEIRKAQHELELEMIGDPDLDEVVKKHQAENAKRAEEISELRGNVLKVREQYPVRPRG
ncbi:MAG: hypothetical protein AAGI48_03925 [Verrucomicrobiota bacterium]